MGDNTNLVAVNKIVVSSNGKAVYAVTKESKIVYWHRNLDSGALSHQINYQDKNLGKASAVAVSPDNQNIYAVQDLSGETADGIQSEYSTIMHWTVPSCASVDGSTLNTPHIGLCNCK